MNDARSTRERYLSATDTSDLRVMADRMCAADQLLAAAYSASGSPRKMLALDIWRLRATRSAAGAREISERLASLVMHRSRKGRHGAPRISRIQAKDMSMAVLKWWQLPTCPTCLGRGHPVIPGTPVLDESRECHDCRGTGTRPLERLVRHEFVEHARWMASEMDSLASIVFDDMARRLRREMDF